MEPWCSDYMGSNRRCSEPSSSTSRSLPINLPVPLRRSGLILLSFRQKLHADGSFDHNKASWVIWGLTQRPGVNYDKIFSPVVKPATVRTDLATAVSHDWPVQHLNVKNAFLPDTLSETVFCSQPIRIADLAHPDLVCRLHKSLYGLKQAP
jgi:hypothetical protein